jgi:WXG100 family type VII secretion target
MDPTVLRGVAQRLRREADQLDQVVTSVQRTIDDAVAHWDGDDAHSFNSWWVSHYRPAATAAHTSLVDMAVTIERNVTEQEKISGAGSHGAAGGGGGGGGGGGWGGSTRPGDLIEKLWPADLIGLGDDIMKTWKGLGLDDLPGGGYLSATLKGIGLGSAGVELVDAIKNGDWSGGMAAGGDGVATFMPAPISLLWTGLSSEIFFFIPETSSEQDDLFTWLQEERGVSPADLGDRYSGVQGFINLGNDNAARKAPWLVDGADWLLAKPAEWLYNAGIRL